MMNAALQNKYKLLQERISLLHTQGLRGLKFAVVSSTFQLGRSYQENLWAESLAEFGASVTVYLPVDRQGPISNTPYISDTPAGAQFYIQEVPSTLLPRNQTLTSLLGEYLADDLPDLIIWFGGIMFFGRDIYLKENLKHIPLVTIYSLSRRGRHSFNWYASQQDLKSRLQSLAFQVLRAPILTQTLKRAQLTVANTPECTDIIRQYLWGADRIEWAKKHEEIPLGFCPHTFSYQAHLRQEARSALPIEERDIVLLHSSRFEANKWPALKAVFNQVENFFKCIKDQGISHLDRYHMLWIGATGNDLSQEFRILIEQSPFMDRHHLISFQTRQRLSTFYHAADIALFAQPSISCQEAIGTGLSILCPPDPSLNHLSRYTNHLHLAALSTWPDELLRISQHLNNEPNGTQRRRQASQLAQNLSYHSLVDQTLQSLAQRLT